MTIKSLGMCLALGTCFQSLAASSQDVQECPLQSQLNALRFDTPYFFEYSNPITEKTSNILKEVQNALPDGIVAICIIDSMGQLVPFACIRPDHISQGARDMVQFSPDELLSFVRANYRRTCSNPSEEHDRDVAESLMNMQQDLSFQGGEGHDFFYILVERTNTLLRVDRGLVVAKSQEDLDLFINTLLGNKDAFERIRQERDTDISPETPAPAVKSQAPAVNPTAMDTE